MSLTQARQKVIDAARAYFTEAFPQTSFIAGQTYIPATAKKMDFADLELLLQASMDMWLTTGRFGRELEAKLPSCLERKTQALLVNSGSSANLVAVTSLGSPMLPNMKMMPLRPGDEIITVAAGFPTTVNPIVQNGWIPVFVDVDLATLNTTPEAVMSAKTSKTRAVVIAHTLGNPYRADEIAAWCRQQNLYLIEDCCDALGAKIGTQPAGSFGEFATLSFYPAHHITMGEGGAVLPRDGKWKRVAESVRDWGRDCWCEPGKDNTCGKRFDWKLGGLPQGYDHKYIYSQLGYNLKVTDMQAALGLSQLDKLPAFVEARKSNWQKISDRIANSKILTEHIIPVRATPGTTPSWFGFAMHCGPALDRNKLTRRLEERKIGTRLLFSGDLTKQPAYANVNFRIAHPLKNTELIMNKTFWMGVHPSLDDVRIDYMTDQLEACVKEQL